MAVVRCVFAAEIDMDLARSSGMHRHACTELVIYLQGNGRLDQDHRRLSYAPGFVSIYQPHLQHADLPTSAGIQICVGVTGCDAEKLPPGMWRGDDDLIQCGARIQREIRRPATRDHQARLDILAGWLVLEARRLIRQERRQPPPLPASVDAAKSILDARFNEKIDLQAMADSLYVSPDHLRHVFKDCLGESPINYLIRRRLDCACEMLNFSDLPVGEIARRVGLDNPYYFSRIFHRRLGLTPSQYRQQKRQGKPA